LMAHTLNTDLRPSDIFTPMTTLTLTTIAIFISTKNLRTTLDWTINGYEEAHKNELIAREHKARLEQVLKQLDTTLAKLQRSNVMLVQTRNQADEARKLKQQFAQTISHELRTPLNLIAGFTETMIKSPEYYGGSLPPAYLRDLSVVYRNAAHLQDLVNDVLDLARLESAYMSLESEELDLLTVIDDAISTARQLVEGRGLVLRTHLPDQLPSIWGDAVRLKQVILNLLNNAARFTEDGEIVVSAAPQDSEVIVMVSDTGIGIPTKNMADIFESFRQLENPMQRRNEGAGLGLAISKQLINLHGGKIWVESEVGVGSVFSFSLPVSQVETLLHDTPISDVVPLDESTLKHNQPQVVLLVTRSPSAAALVSRSLSDFRFLVVPELAQVQRAAMQIMPQAIIIDTSTEPIDQTALQAVIQALQTSQTVIITCPLPGEEPLRQRFAVDGYLIKPITYENLWDVLRQFSDTLNNVLVVDRDPDFVRLIERMLSNPVRHYQITYAYTGCEALEMVKRNRPEIILLDLNLPDMDGQQVIQHIQNNENLRDIRIVIITAYEEIDHSNLLTLPMCISKPSGLKPSEIMRWLQTTLNGLFTPNQ
ncbi:MAG: response regulator, partial [Anaerolineae bacterium]|nr:response regulator [Anaerolineae bacterium]